MRFWDRHGWLAEIESLDPTVDYERIASISSTYEFPWDIQQALSFALFRTYAVPSVGRLLYETGEFTERTQKRHDDTALVLDAISEHGPESPDGRRAIRRMNQMHGAYDISQDDLRYVLSTFVVTPVRWVNAYGWRRMSRNEIDAGVAYYRRIGSLMGIRQIPETYEEFARLLDDYEREHFAYDDGARKVADATLDLLASFYPRPLRGAAQLFALCLMDEPLRRAFGFSSPPRVVVAVARAGLRSRGRLVRFLPPCRKPKRARDLKIIKSYPNGYDIDDLGTFPGAATGCPVPHASAAGGDAHEFRSR